MKTLIAIPCMDTVPTRFCQSVAMLQKEGDVAIAFQVGSLVYDSRNSLAKQAIEMEADWILWLDSDMVFDPDVLKVMLKTCRERDLDFLSGLYFRRVHPFTPVLYKRLDITDGVCEWEEFNDIPTDEIFEVDGCGFGCVLMKADILLDIVGKFGNMFTPINGVGEDLSFCWRAKECGYTLYCDPTISLGHIGNTVITRQVYETLKGQSHDDNTRHD